MKYIERPAPIEANEIVDIVGHADDSGAVTLVGSDGGCGTFDLAAISPADFGDHAPSRGDYWVSNPNGGGSIVAKSEFEARYTPAS